MIGNPTIGADIELFVQRKSDLVIVNAEPFIKGTKHEPFKFDPADEFAAISLDNVLSEFCIAPTKDKVCFVKNINKSMDYITSILPPEYCTVAIPSAILGDEFLQTDNAKLFGCESDYNVWKRSVNKKPNAENKNLRSAGFHVHVGYDNPNIAATEAAVKTLDLFLSVPSLLIEPDNERRKLYGKAGAFRIKPYGFEHRVLSGFFCSSDELKSWVYNNTMAAIDLVNSGGIDEVDSVGDLIQTAINNNDKVLAGNLIRQFQIEMV